MKTINNKKRPVELHIEEAIKRDFPKNNKYIRLSDITKVLKELNATRYEEVK